MMANDIKARFFCQGAAGEQYLDQLFRIFDKDGDGSIDFKVDCQIQQIHQRDHLKNINIIH